MYRIPTVQENVPIPIIHTFRLTDSNSTSANYEPIKTNGDSTWLSKGIRVSQNRNYKIPDPQYYLSANVDRNWPKLIELHSCYTSCILIGYSEEENNKIGDTLLVRFNQNNRTATIFYFKAFYSENRKLLTPFMKRLYRRK